ncbi:nucleotidyl transferase AbiEii/AbiGii toxin family protein [Providencia alcalifaciens]
MLLHEDKQALEEAIRATAHHMKLPVEYIEKDYWVTYALKTLAESDISDCIVFKGGTSLSKAYKMISRFSEDVDIAVLTEGLSPNQAKRKVKKADKIIAAILSEVASDDTSKNSHFRKVRYGYPRMDDTEQIEGQITDSLLLEVNAFADPEPYKKIAICSYISEFFHITNQNELVSHFKLDPFEMNVLCTSRTVCEKIMGMVKASYGDDYITSINSKIRHLYDIYYLMEDDFTRQFVNSAEFHIMIDKVIESDRQTFESTPWFDIPLASACVFGNLEKIWPSLDGTYNGAFKAMVINKDLPAPSLLFSMSLDIYSKLNAIDCS